MQGFSEGSVKTKYGLHTTNGTLFEPAWQAVVHWVFQGPGTVRIVGDTKFASKIPWFGFCYGAVACQLSWVSEWASETCMPAGTTNHIYISRSSTFSERNKFIQLIHPIKGVLGTLSPVSQLIVPAELVRKIQQTACRRNHMFYHATWMDAKEPNQEIAAQRDIMYVGTVVQRHCTGSGIETTHCGDGITNIGVPAHTASQNTCKIPLTAFLPAHLSIHYAALNLVQGAQGYPSLGNQTCQGGGHRSKNESTQAVASFSGSGPCWWWGGSVSEFASDTKGSIVFCVHCAPPGGTATRAREGKLSHKLKHL